MITTALLNLVYFFVLGIVSVISSLGEVSTNNAVTSSIITLKTYYTSLNSYIPIDTIVAIIAFDLAFEAVYLTYKLIRWAYQKVPTIN